MSSTFLKTLRDFFKQRSLNSHIFSLCRKSTRVVIVDPQKDFSKKHKGSLGVQGTETNSGYIERIIKATKTLKKNKFTILATKDWHPANHSSFASQHLGKKPFETIILERNLTNQEKQQYEQSLWPDHCVQQSNGAEFFMSNKLIDHFFEKGTHKEFDSYSGIKDDGGITTGLYHYLQSNEKITTLIIYGLATDYCAHATVMDAVDIGYNVILINDLISAVHPENGTKAIEAMKATKKVIVCESIYKNPLKVLT